MIEELCPICIEPEEVIELKEIEELCPCDSLMDVDSINTITIKETLHHCVGGLLDSMLSDKFCKTPPRNCYNR